jgi:S-DNA-T family DNA segregation ATPase FtsK/SpoIIIE
MTTEAEILSVTEVRNALRCPRVFTLGRRRRPAVAFPVGSSCLGATFHRVVARFAGSVTSPPAAFANLGAGAGLVELNAATVRWLLDFLIDELEADPAYRTMPSEVDDLAEALRELAGYLAERVAEIGASPSRAIVQLLPASEKPVEAFFEGAGVLLRGRIDAIHSPRGDRLLTVEYKLTDEANAELESRPGRPVPGAPAARGGHRDAPGGHALRPALTVYELGEGFADSLVSEVLEPLLARMRGWLARPETAPATGRGDLCAACPVARDCAELYPERVAQRDDPPMAASRPRPAAAGGMTAPATVVSRSEEAIDVEGEAEAARLKARILDELRRDGIAAESRDAVVGPTLYVIPVTRTRGSVKQLDAAANDVIHRLAAADGIELTYERDGGRRVFTAPRRVPRPVLLGPLLVRKREWLGARPGRFVLGQEPNGEIVLGDLSDSATPHLLVAGQTGSGKSWLLRAIVASLVHWHDPAHVRVRLIDPKRVTFNSAGFRTALAAHLDGPVVHEIEEALPCLERYVEVMEERYALFEREEVSDLLELNERRPPERRLPRHVVVMDEFQDLTADRATAREFFRLINRLGAKARGAGVHLVLATSVPTARRCPRC